MDGVQRYVCKQQQDVFGEVAAKGYELYAFADAFLKSSFCNRSIDKPYSVDQFADTGDWFDFLERDGECVLVPTQDPFPVHVAKWLGFVYRQLHIETGISSRELAHLVPIRRLAVSYPGLHTLDEDMQVEIIRNDFGFSGEILDCENVQIQTRGITR